MQKIINDRMRPDGADPHGVAEAKAQLRKAYDMIEAGLDGSPWALGDAFTLADCSAAPALLYANMAVRSAPPRQSCWSSGASEDKAVRLPVKKEAEPYFHMVPK